MELNAKSLQKIAATAGIPATEITKIVTTAYLEAYRTSRNPEQGVTADFDSETGEVTLTAADGRVLPTPKLGPRAALAARQVLTTWLKDQERLAVVGEWAEREGQPVTGTVTTSNNKETHLLIDGTFAALPNGEAIPNEELTAGQELTCLLLTANRTANNKIRLTVSRRQPALVTALLETHLPAGDQTLFIAAAREPGIRTKVACVHPASTTPSADLATKDPLLLPDLSETLGGETLDLIDHDRDLTKYVANALGLPSADGVKITDPKRNHVQVRIAADQISHVEGPGGWNLRLASRLTGTKITLRAL